MPSSRSKSPLELAAQKWLEDPTDRPLLDLALWGIEHGVYSKGYGNLPTTEQVESQINLFYKQPPGAELAWVEGRVEGESRLLAEDLANAPDAQTAALWTFEAILDGMVLAQDE